MLRIAHSAPGDDDAGDTRRRCAWSVQPVPSGGEVADVACAPGGDCAAVDYDTANLSSVTLVYR